MSAFSLAFWPTAFPDLRAFPKNAMVMIALFSVLFNSIQSD